MIYIAHPYDQTHVEADWSTSLRAAIIRVEVALDMAEAPAFWPTRPYSHPMEDKESTYAINEFAVRRCSSMLAILPPGVPSIGVPMEIQTAYNLGKPVAVVGGLKSLQLEAMGVRMFNDTDEAISWLNLLEFDQSRNGHDPRQVIKWTGDSECEPRRGYLGDAGWDLIVQTTTRVPIDGFVDIPHGVCMEMPPGMWALITGRSSTIRRRGLLVVNGIIDNGYRGPLFAAVQNLSGKVITVEKGERIAQLIPFALTSAGATLSRVAELSEHERGIQAFGSTGA
jgi:dUTP pyrophosphatase